MATFVSTYMHIIANVRSPIKNYYNLFQFKKYFKFMSSWIKMKLVTIEYLTVFFRHNVLILLIQHSELILLYDNPIQYSGSRSHKWAFIFRRMISSNTRACKAILYHYISHTKKASNGWCQIELLLHFYFSCYKLFQNVSNLNCIYHHVLRDYTANIIYVLFLFIE